MAAAVQRLGATGSVLLLLAAFVPVWGASQGGSAIGLSLFEAMRFLPLARDELGVTGAEIDDAILGSGIAFAALVLVAAGGYAMALLGARRLLLVPALLGALVAGAILVYTLSEIARVNEELGGAMGAEVRLAWGWIVHLLAVLTLSAAGILGFLAASRPTGAPAPQRGPTAVGGSGPNHAAAGRPAEQDVHPGTGTDWRAASTPHGWMLSGKTAGGHRLRLRLGADDLERGLVLGRGPGQADVLIDDESVSRSHVRVSLGRVGLVFEDLGSTNGTYIEGRRLAKDDGAEVEPGAEVRMGDVRLLLSYR